MGSRSVRSYLKSLSIDRLSRLGVVAVNEQTLCQMAIGMGVYQLKTVDIPERLKQAKVLEILVNEELKRRGYECQA